MSDSSNGKPLKAPEKAPPPPKAPSGGKLTVWLLAIVCVAGIVALVGKAYLPGLGQKAQSTSSSSGVGVGGPFTLVNQFGEAVTEKTYAGKYLLVYFGYTYCPDVCPTALTEMANALDMLGTQSTKIQPIFVSLDPGRDTPAQLKEYVAYFHPALVGLTGTAEQVDAAAKAYRVYYRKNDPSSADANDYTVDHTSIIYLIGPDGKLITHFSHGTSAEAMAERIGKLL